MEKKAWTGAWRDDVLSKYTTPYIDMGIFDKVTAVDPEQFVGPE